MDELVSKGPYSFQNLAKSGSNPNGVSVNGERDSSLDLNRRASSSSGFLRSEADLYRDEGVRNDYAVVG
ncbi:hypothetical protein Hanom_Chr10g00957641 [Helianthus anomalus]